MKCQSKMKEKKRKTGGSGHTEATSAKKYGIERK